MYSTHLFEARARGIIATHDPHAQLFLYFAPNNCHGPVAAPLSVFEGAHKAALADVPNHARRVFAACMMTLDDAVGGIVDSLREAGMWNRTVLFMSSDNGAIPLQSDVYNEAVFNEVCLSRWCRRGAAIRRVSSLTDDDEPRCAAGCAERNERTGGLSLLAAVSFYWRSLRRGWLELAAARAEGDAVRGRPPRAGVRPLAAAASEPARRDVRGRLPHHRRRADDRRRRARRAARARQQRRAPRTRLVRPGTDRQSVSRPVASEDASRHGWKGSSLRREAERSGAKRSDASLLRAPRAFGPQWGAIGA